MLKPETENTEQGKHFCGQYRSNAHSSHQGSSCLVYSLTYRNICIEKDIAKGEERWPWNVGCIMQSAINASSQHPNTGSCLPDMLPFTSKGVDLSAILYG